MDKPKNFFKGLALISIGPTVIANFLPRIKTASPQLLKVLEAKGIDEASVFIITSLLLGVLAMIIGGVTRRKDRSDKQDGAYINTVLIFYFFFFLMLGAYFFLDPSNCFDQTDFALFLFIKDIVPLVVIANSILVVSYILNVFMANRVREKLKDYGLGFIGGLIANVAIMGDGLAVVNRVLVISGQNALIQDTRTIVLVLNILLALTFALTTMGGALIPMKAVENQ